MNHWVIDYETLINCTILCVEHYIKDESKVFVIHKNRNDIKELIDFINQCVKNNEWHISFNGLAFDSQITQYIYENQEALYDQENGESLANWFYQQAQDIIETKNDTGFAKYSEYQLAVKQIDVFKLNHWDNPAKSSSLKWIQYSSDWRNIKDMPIHHSTWINNTQIDEIITYCINDVKSTKHVLHISKELIEVRKTLTEKYKINLYSASEPKIAKELFLLFLSKKISKPKSEIRSLRTFRKQIVVNDILLDYINFKTPEFRQLHETFKNVKIDPLKTKGAFKHVFKYKNVKTVFGLGGIHGAAPKGIYRSNKQMIIMTSDVQSFYPRLAMVNEWSPAHLNKKDFCEQYQWFFDERLKIPKKDPINYVYKIILNSSYGLSNDKNCFLYDPEFTMRITMNGQLSLCMLYEMLTQNIPNSIPLAQNTDGLETMIPIKYKDKYLEICKEWEQLTGLKLEHDTYSEMIISDVNTYIATFNEKEVTEEEYDKLRKKYPHYIYKQANSKFYFQATKCKGRFEFTELPLHKNKSALIIRKAIYNYFIHNIDVEDTIRNSNNIFDFCIGSKIKGNDWCYINRHNVKQQKVIRYYVSNKGERLFKYNTADGRKEKLVADNERYLTVANEINPNDPISSYDVYKPYYIRKAIEEIIKIKPSYVSAKQLNLF